MRNNFFSLILGIFLLVGCSSVDQVTTPENDNIPSSGVTTDNYMGPYELTIDTDSMAAELNPKRQSAIGESLIVSGRSYFDMSPCRDCFKIKGLAYENDLITVRFYLEHPFQKGNPEKPPTGKNRLDLDIFDLALVVVPVPVVTTNYSLTSINIASGIIDNPSGYTNELENLNIDGTNVAFPYVLVVDNSLSAPPGSTYNKFEMGADKDFLVHFPMNPGQTLVFDLYLTFGYGSSAVLKDRFNPKYLNPEFNRKAAWKVTAIPPNGTAEPVQGNTWDDSDNTTLYDVTVLVYDWQVGATVNPALENPTDIYAASGVSKVSLEIPGMHNELKELTSATGGTGSPSEPLIYKFSLANENSLPAGEYTGLVAVLDERSPLAITESRDYLIHTPNGGKTLEPYEIPEYATYQTFSASVVEYVALEEGNLIWAKRAGGTSTDTGRAITTLSDNSTVVTGAFVNTATFGQGEPNETVLTSTGNSDIFVARFNPNRTLAWAKQAGGQYSDSGLAITSLSDDSTIVAGSFTNSATFGPNETGETILTSAGENDIFIARFNTNGTLAWAKSAGGENEDDYCYAVTALSDDSVVIAGNFKATATFGAGEPGETTLTAPGWNNVDLFIARYNSNGTLAWAKLAGGDDIDHCLAATALSDDSIVVTGFFNDSATFGAGETNETTLSSAFDYCLFIARYNSNGTLAWAKCPGGVTSNSEGYGIASLSDNSTVLTGYFEGSIIFGEGDPNETTLSSAGDLDTFIAKYNPDGTIAWAKRAGGSDWQAGYGVTKLSDNSTVVIGLFAGSSVFGEGELNETTFAANANPDIFVARYNTDGTLAWAKKAGGSNYDAGYGITALSDDSTTATGFFQETATFGIGEPNQTILTSAGGWDMYIARFAP